jgi:transcriptional regulator with XRE-family HTH domain
MLTDLGKMVRNLCTNAELKQEQLATDLGCSPGALSNYINGKTVPEMEVLAKLVDRFDLKGNDLKNLFAKAFFGSVKSSHKIILDTRYFRKDRFETLVQVIVALLLVSGRPDQTTRLPKLAFVIDSVKSSFDAMDADDFLELVKYPKNENKSQQLVHKEGNEANS